MISVWIVFLALPLVIGALARPGAGGFDRFLVNAAGNGLWATTLGVVAGNVGIGTFIAIFAFTAVSPVIGIAVVAAYTAGLLLCAALAPLIRRQAVRHAAHGLIDLIARSHDMRGRGGIWLPVAVMFVLRAAVQLGALGLLLAPALGLGQTFAIGLSAGIIALYLVLGGYAAAVRTDMAQAVIVIAAMAIAATGLSALPEGRTPLGTLGPYKPSLLVGIMIFLPLSAVLAIDNWQRVTVAESTQVARQGFLCAAPICCGIYAVIAVAGYRSMPGADVFMTFADLMPAGLGWIAIALFVACIMSSIDTFIMPLITSLNPDNGMRRLRLLIVGLMGATAACAIVFGDILLTVVAAFNSLTALLPATLGALFLARPSATAAVVSVNAGFASAVIMGRIDVNTAAIVGFLVATVIYGALTGLKARATD